MTIDFDADRAVDDPTFEDFLEHDKGGVYAAQPVLINHWNETKYEINELLNKWFLHLRASNQELVLALAETT